MENMSTEKDKATADAFATSWNNLPAGSVYTFDQFVDWMAPLVQKDAEGKRVLELGCGNASLMVHMVQWNPSYLEGVDLGESVKTAVTNLSRKQNTGWKITQHDLTTFSGDELFDVVYCIGVLHHLKDPRSGFDSMLRNTISGGAFHGWVYAREGNGVVRYIVDPIRKIASRLPWWFTKYAIATPLVAPYFVYAKVLAALPASKILSRLPLYEYSQWIAKRDFLFFRHVAFDQLVTPQTAYIPRSTIEAWLKGNPSIDQGSTYIIFRNGNSWKFGGRKLR